MPAIGILSKHAFGSGSSHFNMSPPFHNQCFSIILQFCLLLQYWIPWAGGWGRGEDASAHRTHLPSAIPPPLSVFIAANIFCKFLRWLAHFTVQLTHVHLKVNSHHHMDRVEKILFSGIKGAVSTKSIWKSICPLQMAQQKWHHTAVAAFFCRTLDVAKQ